MMMLLLCFIFWLIKVLCVGKCTSVLPILLEVKSRLKVNLEIKFCHQKSHQFGQDCKLSNINHNFMPIQQQSLDRFIFKVYLCWSLFVLKDQVILMVTNSSIPTTLLWIYAFMTSLSSLSCHQKIKRF